jgi:hypothetical protein
MDLEHFDISLKYPFLVSFFYHPVCKSPQEISKPELENCDRERIGVGGSSLEWFHDH